MSRKKNFFEGCSWFKFNNLGLELGMALKFYISVAKGVKIKVRMFWGLIPTFLEVSGGKLVVEGPFCPLRPKYGWYQSYLIFNLPLDVFQKNPFKTNKFQVNSAISRKKRKKKKFIYNWNTTSCGTKASGSWGKKYKIACGEKIRCT